MSLGPRTQNEITEAVKRIPGIMKWLGQLDEKVKNLNVSEPIDTNLIDEKLAELVDDLSKTFTKELDEAIQSLAKSSQADNERVDIEKNDAFKKLETKITKQQKEFEQTVLKSIEAMEQKIIDLSKQLVNNSKTTKTTTQPIVKGDKE